MKGYTTPLNIQLVSDEQLSKILTHWQRHITLILSLALEVQEYRNKAGKLGYSFLTIKE